MKTGEVLPVRCSILRGGTSRGVFFLERDLPTERPLIERLLLDAMGSPDIRQINGLGGATAQTSKVAIIGPSREPDADVDYTFAQVDVVRPIVDWGGTCGNLSAAVGVFAVDHGLVRPPEGRQDAVVRVRVMNTGQRIAVRVPVVDGKAAVTGDFAIPGVPGTGTRIRVQFLDPGGSFGRGLLPTGSPTDTMRIGGRAVTVSLVDAGVPVVFAAATDLGLESHAMPAQIDGAKEALRSLEHIRGNAAVMLGIVDDWRDAASASPGLPKVAMVGPPQDYFTQEGQPVAAGDQDICARQMAMQRAHQSYAVTGAIAAAAAAAIPGTVVAQVARPAAERPEPGQLRIGQPYGVMVVGAQFDGRSGATALVSAEVSRTARHIMDGTVLVRTASLRAADLDLASAWPGAPDEVATSELVDLLGSSATACDLQFRQFGGTPRFAGRIRTISCYEDNLLVRNLLSEPGEGQVLVIDAGGSLRTAMLGGRVAAEAAANGWRGIVVRGAIRDVQRLCETPIGIKALGSTPAPSAKRGIGAIDVPVSFGGTTFVPGDQLFSDDDGILVSPTADAVSVHASPALADKA